MNIKINNFKCVFGWSILVKVLNLFMEVFVSMYFLQLSESSIVPLGLYNLFRVILIVVVFYVLRNITKQENRIILLRIGSLFWLIYLALFLIFRDNVIHIAYIVGAVSGVGDGAFYSVYNIYESDGVDEKDRPKLYGRLAMWKSVIQIIFPVVSGFIIDNMGFSVEAGIIFLLVIGNIVLSFFYNDDVTNAGKKFDLKGFFNKVKYDKMYLSICLQDILNGLTNSEGAWKAVILIYTIRVFSSNTSIGILTAIANVAAWLIGGFFVNVSKRKKQLNILSFVFSALFIVGLAVMLINPTLWTIALFNMFVKIHYSLIHLVHPMNNFGYLNSKEELLNYKEEYFMLMEIPLAAARALSHLLFLLLAFTNGAWLIILLAIANIAWTYVVMKIYNKQF